MAEDENFVVPTEDIIIGYQNELAGVNHRNIVLVSRLRHLQQELTEALADNERLRKIAQEKVAERNTGATASDQEVSK